MRPHTRSVREVVHHKDLPSGVLSLPPPREELLQGVRGRFAGILGSLFGTGRQLADHPHAFVRFLDSRHGLRRRRCFGLRLGLRIPSLSDCLFDHPPRLDFIGSFQLQLPSFGLVQSTQPRHFVSVSEPVGDSALLRKADIPGIVSGARRRFPDRRDDGSLLAGDCLIQVYLEGERPDFQREPTVRANPVSGGGAGMPTDRNPGTQPRRRR